MQQISLMNMLDKSSAFLSQGVPVESVQKDGEGLNFGQLVTEALRGEDGEKVPEDFSVLLSVIVQNILNFMESNRELSISGESFTEDTNSDNVDLKIAEVMSEIKNASDNNELLKYLSKLSDLMEQTITKPQNFSLKEGEISQEVPNKLSESVKDLLTSLVQAQNETKMDSVNVPDKGIGKTENVLITSAEVVENIKNILTKLDGKDKNAAESVKPDQSDKSADLKSVQTKTEFSVDDSVSDEKNGFFNKAGKDNVDISISEDSNKIFETDEKIQNSKVSNLSDESLLKAGTMESQKTNLPENDQLQTKWEINSKESVEKLIKMIEFVKNGESKTLTVKIEPDFLGKMNIHLTDNAGKISAKIFIEHDSVKNFLVNNAENIRQQLADKGIHIDNMDFMFMGDHKNQDEYREARSMFNIKTKTAQVPESVSNEQTKNDGIYA